LRIEFARGRAAWIRGLFLALLAAGLPACLSVDEEEEETPALTEEERREATDLEGRIGKAFEEAMTLRGAGPEAPENPRVLEALDGAATLCREYLDRFPSEAARDQVLYRLGMLCEASGEFEDAHAAFEELIGRHPGSGRFREALEAEMRIARRLFDGEKVSFLGLRILGGSSTGAEILEKLGEVAPFASFGDEALYRLGNYRLERGEFDEAVVHYETLVRRFPDSSLRIKAEYQAARSFFLKFHSLDYDLTPLEEALERFRAFIELHEENPSEEVRILAGPEGARKMKAEIEGLLAEKNYRVGNWYRNRGRPEAARPYYRVVMSEYPLTEWAKRAEEKLKDMGP
jgi:outer membrane protein assembly factor BamD (BamD/ComL family)